MGSAPSLVRNLIAAGILPTLGTSGKNFACEAADFDSLVPNDHDAKLVEPNLLPPLLRSWQSHQDDQSSERTRQITRWLYQQKRSGGRIYLTNCVPTLATWCPHRLVWFRGHFDRRRATSILSSRLSSDPAEQGVWLRRLCQLSHLIRTKGNILNFAAGSAGSSLVRRCIQLFGVNGRCVFVAAKQLQLSTWWRQCRTAADEPSVCFSPAIPQMHAQPTRKLPPSLPAADRALAALGSQLYVLSVRRNGNVHHLLKWGLEHDRFAEPPRVVIDLRLTPAPVVDELLRDGAIGLYLDPADRGAAGAWTRHYDHAPHVQTRVKRPNWRVRRRPRIRRIPHIEPWPYLTHCTRAVEGPYPDQSQEEYLDQLVWDGPAARQNPLTTLSRIIQQRCIRASAQAIRGGFSVVCFTDAPLWSLNRLTRYRAHRRRWDFLPFGICIRRSAFQPDAIRPVIYGDDAVWNTLSAADRPYFQLSRTRRRAGSTGIKWTGEREWRHVGDVRLEGFTSPDDILVVVPNYAHAQQLSPHCPWTFVVSPSPCRT